MNMMAYLLFFDYHYSLSIFMYKFFPKKCHIQEPLVYSSSYPALPHPWVKKILDLFKLDSLYFLKNFNSYQVFWFNLVSKFLQFVWSFLFLCFFSLIKLILNLFKSNLMFMRLYYVFVKLRNMVWYSVVLCPMSLNVYFLVLGFISFISFSCLFSIVMFFVFYVFVQLFKKRTMYFLSGLKNLVFYILGFLFFMPFSLVLFMVSVMIYLSMVMISSGFNLFCFLMFFCFFLGLNVNFLFEFWLYVLNSVCLGALLDFFNYYILGFFLEFDVNWKSFLINNLHETSFYMKLW